MAPVPKDLLFCLILCLVAPMAISWIVPQPKANVWRTLASALGQENICLDTGSAEDPMSSCLVGIPLPPLELPPPFSLALHYQASQDPGITFWSSWRSGIRQLAPLDTEPQELHLLGSAHAPSCIVFRFIPGPKSPPLPSQSKGLTTLTPADPRYQVSQWCGETMKVPISSTPDQIPRALPRGIFLICGDRAWAGIPSNQIGGPCALGRLTLLTPNITQIFDWRSRNSSLNSTSEIARPKRGLENLDPDCDSEIQHWSKPKIVALTLFLPWVSIAKSLGELARLECWAVKQANITSAALSDLLFDERVTRQATLQNRAAIDFLLLLHHHRCEEFEGLCCLNLSSRAEDARVAIDRLQNLVHQVKQQSSDWLGDILAKWGLSGWASSILKTVFTVVFVLVIVCVASSILWGLLKRLLNQMWPIPQANHVEDVESQSDEKVWDPSLPEDPESVDPDGGSPEEDDDFSPPI